MPLDDAQIEALLRQLDHSPPVLDAGTIAARARGRRVAALRRAAIIVLALGGAGVAAAAPASPVRAWLAAAREWLGEREPAEAPRATRAPSAGGVAIAPGDRLVIELLEVPAGSTLRVVLAETVEVTVSTAATGTTYVSEPERLAIRTEPGPAVHFDIEIPRSAPAVEIRANGRVLLSKDRDRIDAAAPAAAGAYLLDVPAFP